MVTGKNYVGSHLLAGGDKVFKTFNPRLNIDNPWQFIEASTYQIKLATSIAKRCFYLFENLQAKKKHFFSEQW